MLNSCFIDNSFVGDAPVIRFGGLEDLDVRNNYVDPVDDSLNCSFVASYENQATWYAGNSFFCTQPDVQVCQAKAAPTPPPQQPADAPTRFPVPRVTLAPVVSPTSRPVGPPESGSAIRHMLVAVIVGVSMLLKHGYVLLE